MTITPVPTESETMQLTTDAAWASAWLHGGWRWLTRCMSTDQRETAADAVERHWARVEADDPACTHDASTRMALRWWREDALDTELEDAVREASAACRTLARVMKKRGTLVFYQQPELRRLPRLREHGLLADADLTRIASGRQWLVWSHLKRAWLDVPGCGVQQHPRDAGLYTWEEVEQIRAAVTWTPGCPPSEVAVMCPADIILQSDTAVPLLAHLVENETGRMAAARAAQGQ